MVEDENKEISPEIKEMFLGLCETEDQKKVLELIMEGLTPEEVLNKLLENERGK